MIKPCRICKTIPSPIPSRWKNRNYICNSCSNKINKEKGWDSIWDKSRIGKLWHRKYLRNYCSNPNVKRKLAEGAKERRNNPKERYKILARELTRRMIKLGVIVKKPCEVCGKKKVQTHHDNYDKPLIIRWLCLKHHVEYHKKAGA